MMSSISDSSIGLWNTILQWIVVIGTIVSVIATVSLIFIRTEIGKRQKDQISNLKNEAVIAKKDITITQAQAAQANEKAESERLRRVQLEISFEPRAIALGGASLRDLRLFPKTNVEISCAGADDEIKGFAINLGNQLEMVNWKVTRGDINPTEYTRGSGVLILSHRTDPEPPSIYNDAAKILQFVLNDNGIEAMESVAREVPNNIIQVKIGAKPQRYFESRQTQKMLEARGQTFGIDPNSPEGRSRSMMKMLSDPIENLKYRLRYDSAERERIIKKYSGNK
jgi:hypothetical protein